MDKERLNELKALPSEKLADAVVQGLNKVIEARKRIKDRVEEIVNSDRALVEAHKAVNK